MYQGSGWLQFLVIKRKKRWFRSAKMVKSFVKRLIPQKYRLMRYALYQHARYYPELLMSLGSRFECPFCHWTFRRLGSAGFDYPILIEKGVVGAAYHPNDVCPRCKSNARERLVYTYLKGETPLFQEPATVLHIAPEPNLASSLKTLSQLKYFTGDLFEEGVAVRLDVMQLPFPAEKFDWIICNHVLEHVADDRAAMRELRRVLRPKGNAVLQVPIATKLESTLEDPAAVSEAERIEKFGQRDHVRLYCLPDYLERLRSAGFSVEARSALDYFGKDSVSRYAMIEDELIISCRKNGNLN
jgi:SAM-dependent methyltransferase